MDPSTNDGIIDPYAPLKQESRTVYVTPDGQEFQVHADAIRHRMQVIIAYEFLNNPLYSDGPGGRVSLGKITDWINSNADLVQHIKDFHLINCKKTDE